MIEIAGRELAQGQGADAADVAMRALTHLFSSRRIIERAHFRCGMGGPTDFDVFFESALDQDFGQNPSSHYKCWVRRLHKLGLISQLPSEWGVQDAENSVQSGHES